MKHRTLGLFEVEFVKDGLADLLFTDGTLRQFRTSDIDEQLFEADPLEWISMALVLATDQPKPEPIMNLPKPNLHPKMRWLADEFDHRATSDDSPELMGSFTLSGRVGQLTRDLIESADFFVQLGDHLDPELQQALRQKFTERETGHLTVDPEDIDRMSTLNNVILKTIRRRNPEFQEQLDSEEAEPELELVSEEDAMLDAEQLVDTDRLDEYEQAAEILPDEVDIMFEDQRLEQTVSAPKARFDLVEDIRAAAGQTLSRPIVKLPKGTSKAKAKHGIVLRTKEGKMIRRGEPEELQGFSAPVFPYPRDKRIQGRGRYIELAIRRNSFKNGAGMYRTVKSALDAGHISRSQAKRLWELYKLAHRHQAKEE